MRAAIFSPHRQRIQHDCREGAGHSALKEHVTCGDWKGAFAMARNEGCSKNQGVEMTAMVRGEHKRSVRRQLLAADDRESMRDRKITSQQRKTNLMRKAFEKPALTSDAPKPLARRKAGIARRLKFPRFHHLPHPVKICCG